MTFETATETEEALVSTNQELEIVIEKKSFFGGYKKITIRGYKKDVPEIIEFCQKGLEGMKT
jgi:hypothetical protein